jgi:hypothetical protein
LPIVKKKTGEKKNRRGISLPVANYLYFGENSRARVVKPVFREQANRV